MDEEEEEDYVLYGTPLPEIEDEATLKKKAAKELQVRDEKGRQRFHGAFTGGFSAGFFNTVGSKEGWAPSTFISSRNNVSNRIQQNPEDFMDDEDFGEFGIATRKIHTTSNFQDTSHKNLEKRKYIDTENVIPGEAPLKDIVQPVRESIGIVILKKLGWRQGQGIGPRIKKSSATTKIYGCSLFPETSIVEENDPMAAAFTFAPEDTEGMSYQSKDNYFGLGYTGLSKQSVLGTSIDPFAPTTTKSWLTKDKKKLRISGQAFGVGAFEEEDEDIYGKDDMSQYDFSDLVLKESKTIKAIGTMLDACKPISQNTRCILMRIAKVLGKLCNSQKHGNFQGIIEGYKLASQPPILKKHYPPPSLPVNFKPIHLKSTCSVTQNVNIKISRHPLSASDRSLLLGERKFQKVSLNEEKQKSDLQSIYPLSSSSSSGTAATSVNFRPFVNDLSKQKRYEDYLRLKGKGDERTLVQPSSMTEWEKQQELEEFSKASILYRPSSNMLSSRFESRSQLSVEHEVMSALEKIKNEKEQQVVIKKDLVGTSNRKTFEWHPVSLLCKRMNVPNPYPNSETSGTQSGFKTKSVFDHLIFNSEKTSISEKRESPEFSSSKTTENKIEESSKTMPDNAPMQFADTTIPVKSDEILSKEITKPPIDFFKDIFENSSSDEDEEFNEQDNSATLPKDMLQNDLDSPAKNERALKNTRDPEIKNVSSQKKDIASSANQNSASKKVGFGVFANLDLDALNQRKPTEKSISDVVQTKKDMSASNLKNDCEINQPEPDDVYGPELPPNYSGNPVTCSPNKISSRKHVKSKSKHKHKHKHKKKKKKSKRNSSCSDLSEFDDIPPLLIIEKMKKLQKRKL